MLRITYSPSFASAPFLPPMLPESVWKSAMEDLDRLHSSVSNPNYFDGHVYWIASKEEVKDNQLIHIDYQLIYRVAEGWISSCVCYSSDEDSPEPWMTEYQAEQAEQADQEDQEDQEDQKEAIVYCEYENFCFICQANTDRTCSECSISICDGCCPNRNLCSYCVSDHLEFH